MRAWVPAREPREELELVQVWRPARVPEPPERRAPERLVLGLQPVRERQALVLTPGAVREQVLASAREPAWSAWAARAPGGRPVVAD